MAFSSRAFAAALGSVRALVPRAGACTVALAVALLVVGTGAGAQDAPSARRGSEVQFIALTPAEFAEKAAELVGKDVEVGGDIEVPRMLSPRSVGTMVDKASGKVLVQLVAGPGSRALEWLAGGGRDKSQGVYARGKVVMVKDHPMPVLDLAEISKESKVKAAAETRARTQAIGDKDREGLVKEVLPPHTNPSGEAARAWLDRVPVTSPDFDRAKSIWENMQNHAKWRGQAEADDRRAIIRGPERPAEFETYYRGVRDTGLKDLFKDAPYKGSTTSWPRVMIVIEEKPTLQGSIPSEYWHNKGGKTETDYTWRFRATVWTDATHRIEIAPFNWAFSELRYNTPYSEVPIWGRTSKRNVPAPEGAPVAAGDPAAPAPAAPKHPLPDRPDYHRLFHYNTIMVGNVLLDMGFNYNRPDGRVWFVEDIAK
jgi:hypothetical protein